MATTSGRRWPIGDQFVAEDLRPGPGGRARHSAGTGRAGHLVQAVVLVLDSRAVSEALLRDHVHQDGAAVLLGPAQGLLDHGLVVAVDGAEVLQPQVLEQHLGLQDVLEALLDAVQRPVHRRPDHRSAGQRGLDVVEHVLVPLADADRRQVLGQAADRRLVGPAIVVDHDDQPGVLGHGDVVQRLPGHPAGQRTVPDDRDDRTVGLAAQLVRFGQPIGVGQARRRVRVLDDVVIGLGPARVPGHAAPLPQGPELRLAPGQELVHVGLVTGVEDDAVLRRAEDPVQRDRQLDDTKVRAEMAAGADDGLDEGVAYLTRQDGQLLLAEALQVFRASDGLQQGHVGALLVFRGFRGLVWDGASGGPDGTAIPRVYLRHSPGHTRHPRKD